MIVIVTSTWKDPSQTEIKFFPQTGMQGQTLAPYLAQQMTGQGANVQIFFIESVEDQPTILFQSNPPSTDGTIEVVSRKGRK